MNWDSYYLSICNVVAQNSKCLSRKIGSIIVKDKSIISTGYNGPASHVPSCSKRWIYDTKFRAELNRIDNIRKVDRDTPIPMAYLDLGYEQNVCPRQGLYYKSGEGLEWCVASHSERNAIFQAAKCGISIKDTTIYMNWILPCKECLNAIINSGIKEIVCTSLEYYDKMSEWIVTSSGIIVRTYEE